MYEIIRYAASPPELLTRDGDGQKRLRGTAAVYYNGQAGSQYQLAPNIIERIAPGAFKAALKDADVYAAVNHDPKQRFARTPKTLQVWQDESGLHYEAVARDVNIVRDLMSDIQDELIRGSSFRALVDFTDKTTHAWSREGDMKIVTIKRFNKLIDVSPVDTPAYDSTSVEVVQRSLDEWERWGETLARLEMLKGRA